MTNEEILEKKFYRPETRDWYKTVLSAMDAARKDEAIAFAEWVALN